MSKNREFVISWSKQTDRARVSDKKRAHSYSSTHLGSGYPVYTDTPTYAYLNNTFTCVLLVHGFHSWILQYNQRFESSWDEFWAEFAEYILVHSFERLVFRYLFLFENQLLSFALITLALPKMWTLKVHQLNFQNHWWYCVVLMYVYDSMDEGEGEVN